MRLHGRTPGRLPGGNLDAVRRGVALGLSVAILSTAGCASAEGRPPPPEGRRIDELVPVPPPGGTGAPEAAVDSRRIPDVAAAPPGGAPGPGDRTVGPGGTDPDARAAGAAPQPPDAAGTGDADVPGTPLPLRSSFDGEEPPPELAAAILGAYEAFWDSYWDAASHPVNPTHPGIERYSTEPLRSRAIGVLLGRATEGIALRLPEDHDARRMVRIEGWDRDGAELLDCFVDTAVLYEVSTGRVRNDEQATVVHLALMRRAGDGWRVAEIFEQATHTGRTDGCTMQANTTETRGPTGRSPVPQPGGEAGGAAPGQESPW